MEWLVKVGAYIKCLHPTLNHQTKSRVLQNTFSFRAADLALSLCLKGAETGAPMHRVSRDTVDATIP